MRAPAQLMCHSGLHTVPPAPGASAAFPSKAAFCPQGCKPPAASLVVTSPHLCTPHPRTSRPLARVWLQRSPRFALGLGAPGSHKEDPQMLWFLQWLSQAARSKSMGSSRHPPGKNTDQGGTGDESASPPSAGRLVWEEGVSRPLPGHPA